jgi:hypothetical protein
MFVLRVFSVLRTGDGALYRLGVDKRARYLNMQRLALCYKSCRIKAIDVHSRGSPPRRPVDGLLEADATHITDYAN